MVKGTSHRIAKQTVQSIIDGAGSVESQLRGLLAKFAPDSQALNPVTLVADSLSDRVMVDQWLAALERSRYEVESWTFEISIFVETGGVEQCGLKLVGTELAKSADATTEGRAFLPKSYKLIMGGLERLYRDLQQVTDYDIRNYLEYALCIGYAAIVLGDAVRATRWSMFRSARVFVQWSCGDGVEIRQ